MSERSQGLRGNTLEELINLTNENYRANGLAVVQKVPTPITPVRFDQESRNITLAYFEQKSTVDYIGAAQGLPICFDAKETGRKSLPIKNIHEHQIEFMREFERQGGIAFLIVHFTRMQHFFLLPLAALSKTYEQAGKGGRKSIPYEDFDQRLRIQSNGRYYVHYLEAINAYFDVRQKGEGAK